MPFLLSFVFLRSSASMSEVMTDDEERAMWAEIDMLTARLRLKREAIEQRIAAQQRDRPSAKVLEFRPRTV